jgi:uncharacterized protein (DUF1015 family)
MAEVIPLKGVLFNVPEISKASSEDLLSPPYDVITPEYKDELYKRSPYNIVRVDFGKEYPADNDSNNKYTRAKAYLDKWLEEGVLITSRKPCFYTYEMSYNIDDKEKKLRGFIGLVRLEALGRGNVHPHECTHAKPKKDRFELMRICGGNISPIFSLYNSPERKASRIFSDVCKNDPYIEARDVSNDIHRIWCVSDEEQINSIKAELSDKSVFIADGHHRYETALEYQEQMRGKRASDRRMPYDYVLMFLANMADEGLTIFPTHRLAKEIPGDSLKRLSAFFDIHEIHGNLDIATSIFGRENSMGFYKGDADTWYILTYRGGDLMDIPPALRNFDVTILHELIFKRLLYIDNVAYEMDIQKTLNLVKEKEFAAAFFLNPTRVEDVEQVALASERMPPKSTYFYPKLLTGLVVNIYKNSF